MDVNSKGEPYYKCQHRVTPVTYKEGISISNESAGQGRSTAQVYKIVKMNDRDDIDPMLELGVANSDEIREVTGERLCREGFKPLKSSEVIEGSAASKKRRLRNKKNNFFIIQIILVNHLMFI